MKKQLTQLESQLLAALEELRTVYLFNQTKTQAKNNHINDTLIKVNKAINSANSEIKTIGQLEKDGILPEVY